MKEWRHGPRNHQFTNSYTTKELGDYARVNYPEMPKYIGRGIFNKLIYAINKRIADKTLEGHCVTLPMRMGYLEIRKKKLSDPKIKDGKLVIAKPVNWQETMNLWKEDKVAYEKRVLVRYDEKEEFFIYYNKYGTKFRNKNYTILRPCKDFCRELYRRASTGEIDAPELIKRFKKKKWK